MNGYDEVILFGAGKFSYKLVKILDIIGISIKCFVDNSKDKVGTEYLGKKVFDANFLKTSNEKILISSVSEVEIRNQIIKMGLEDRLINSEEFFALCIECVKSKFLYMVSDAKISSNTTYVFSNFYDMWGGIEEYNAVLEKEIKKLGADAILYSLDIEKDFKGNFGNVIEYLIDDMKKRLPIVIFNSREDDILFAATVLKERYPEQVKIFTIVHASDEFNLNRYSTCSKYSDMLICTSEKIVNELTERYMINKEKIIMKHNFLRFDIKSPKVKNNNEIIRIGYAGRLEKRNKRADLLIELIKKMEENKHVNYLFEIAGHGQYYDKLKKYINENGLESKVNLLGKISSEKMQQFWLEQDIGLNVSDNEGQSLAMIESMGCGAVPIVSNVSGTEIIDHGMNGFVCDVGNLDEFVKYIGYLYDNREEMNNISKNAIDTIKRECDKQKYARFLIDTVKGLR